MKLAISGASGKTGYRIAEEALKKGIRPKLLIRNNSVLPDSLANEESITVSLNNPNSLDSALCGCEVLIIATGARPGIDLTGPAKIDACGVRNQIEACKRNNVSRIILISSLCTGRLLHPLNLFGLILIWKRLGESFLEKSGLDWTIIRPGGLNEEEDKLSTQGILFTSKDSQEKGYIPRRLLAQACIESLSTPTSIGKIIEITSNEDTELNSMEKALASFTMS